MRGRVSFSKLCLLLAGASALSGYASGPDAIGDVLKAGHPTSLEGEER